MTGTINALAAQEHTADLRRDAARRRLDTVSERLDEQAQRSALAARVELRAPHTGEERVATRLAALDNAPELDGPILLAVVEGEAVAALSLLDGRVVADPFRRTADPVALLRLRAAHIAGDGGQGRPRLVSMMRIARAQG